MKRFGVWGLSAALIVGGTSVAKADSDSPPPPPEKGTLLGKLFGPKPPKPAGPTVRSGPAIVTAPLKPEVVAEAFRAEQAAWNRRMEVCLELKRVAAERGDETLARQADDLERQATDLFNARTAGFGMSRTKAPLPEPTPTSAVAAFDPAPLKDYDAVGQAKKLSAPSAPIPGSTAEVREVKP
jgi:hypothetical protein